MEKNIMDTGEESSSTCQVIYAPSRPTIKGQKTIFLAGTTSKTSDEDWRETLSGALGDLDITIFNPFRADWDGSWKEDLADSRFKEQVEWELEMQDHADLIVVYLHPESLAPISLLELGLCARSGKAIVVCPEGYWKRGNVQAVCQRFNLTLVDNADDLIEALLDGLNESGFSQ
jgi:hypothetical protein